MFLTINRKDSAVFTQNNKKTLSYEEYNNISECKNENPIDLPTSILGRQWALNNNSVAGRHNPLK
jgi:hypothetical protein